MQLNTIARGGANSAGQRDWNRDNFMQSSAELDLVSVTGQRDVLQWGIRNFTRIQQVGDISYVGVDDAIFYVDEKGVRIVEGGIYVQVSTRHLAAKPPHINAKVWAVPQH